MKDSENKYGFLPSDLAFYSNAMKATRTMKKKIQEHFYRRLEMINGNPNDFLETVYNGTSLEYSYNGRTFFTESYYDDGKSWMVTYHCDDAGNDEDYLIKRTFAKGESIVDYYVNAPIFEGKTFWEVEKDIEWLY